jgi:hypothetical protein
MYRIPENTPEQTSLNSTKIAWSRLFSSVRSMQTTLESAMSRSQKDRENIASEIEKVIAKCNAAEETLNGLNANLRGEMQKSLASAATSVFVNAQNTHNRLRLAIASSDLRIVSDSEEGKQRLDRAATERKRWIESLRTSLKWELAR